MSAPPPSIASLETAISAGGAGRPHALLNLGLAYERGEGVARDAEMAAVLFVNAARAAREFSVGIVAAEADGAAQRAIAGLGAARAAELGLYCLDDGFGGNGAGVE